MKRKILQVSALFFCLFTFPVFAMSEIAPLTYHVNIHNGNDSNDGLSWSSAFKNLQAAINVAIKGDTIKVAAGTYHPTEKLADVYNEKAIVVNPTNDRHRSFLIQEDILLYGGFPADATNATTMNDRDWIKYETILSGDFNGDDGEGFENMDENALHVVVMLFVTSATRLDGFFITGGNASADSATVYVDNVIIQQHCGGGVYAISKFDSSPTLANLVIQYNQAEHDGGGFYNYSESGYASPLLENVTIKQNFADERGGGFYNDGMFAEPTLLNVDIAGNLATYYGGGFHCIAEKAAAPYLENVLIAGNKARSGGGAYILAIEEDVSPVIINATVSGNKATGNGSGGGIVIAALTASANPALPNTILYGNKSNTVDNIIIEGKSGSSPVFTNAFIESQSLTDAFLDPIPDPMFVAPVDADFAPTVSGNYRLRPESPIIDAGDNYFVTLSTDLDGQTRIIGASVDLGAYEFQGDDSGNEVRFSDNLIWSHQNSLYVKIANQNVNLRIYSINGNLVKQVNSLLEGFYSFPLPGGIYIVTLSTGETAKIFISL